MFLSRRLCSHFALHLRGLLGKSLLFTLFYGREPLLPMDVSLLSPTKPAGSIAEHRPRIVKQIELAQQIAKENITRTQRNMKAYYDRHATKPDFVEGLKD